MAEPRGSCAGVHPGTFDPIHSHLDIIRRATLFDVAEDVAAVAHLVAAAEPNEPDGGGDPDEAEPDGPAPTAASGRSEPDEPEPNSFESEEPGGGDPNEPEVSDGSGPGPAGRPQGEPHG
jgi:hypothetical protein